jgi:hypothetical protein
MSPPGTLSRSQSLCGVVAHQRAIPVAIMDVIRVCVLQSSCAGTNLLPRDRQRSSLPSRRPGRKSCSRGDGPERRNSRVGRRGHQSWRAIGRTTGVRPGYRQPEPRECSSARADGHPVEAKVLADVNGTSGIQTQAYATSVLATLRKGRDQLEVAGYTRSAYVLHPTDWEGVELALSSTNAVEHLSLPYDPATRPAVGRPGDHQQRAGGRRRTRNRNGRSRFGHRYPRRRRPMVGKCDS